MPGLAPTYSTNPCAPQNLAMPCAWHPAQDRAGPAPAGAANSSWQPVPPSHSPPPGMPTIPSQLCGDVPKCSSPWQEGTSATSSRSLTDDRDTDVDDAPRERGGGVRGWVEERCQGQHLFLLGSGRGDSRVHDHSLLLIPIQLQHFYGLRGVQLPGLVPEEMGQAAAKPKELPSAGGQWAAPS